jgi:hypothetical protein
MSTARTATATIIRRTVNRTRGNLMSGVSVTSAYSRGVPQGSRVDLVPCICSNVLIVGELLILIR